MILSALQAQSVLLQGKTNEPVLPWSNGSLLSGKLVPASDGQGVMLLLGNYRLRAEVPPNVPMGHVWLQLVRRDMPGTFHILSDKEAIAWVAQMLRHKAEQGGVEHKAMPQAEQSQGWGKLATDTLPFAAHMHDHHLTLTDEHRDTTKGVVCRDISPDGFRLFGRLDFARLGKAGFSLRGDTKRWSLQVYLEHGHAVADISDRFEAWLSKKAAALQPSLEGRLSDAMPDDLGGADRYG